MSTKNLTSSFPLELDAALNSSHSVSVRLQSYRERHHILRSGRSIGEQDRAMLNDVDMVGVDAAAPVGAHAEAVAAGEEEGREEQEAVGEVEAIGDDKPETVSDTPRSSDYPPSVPGQSASSILPSRRREWPSGIAWIPPKLNWKGIRPVVRSAVALWLGLMLLIVYDSEVLLGQAAFLVLIVSVLSPASLPIATQLEWSILQILISAFSWAYTCLVLLIANAVRSQYSFNEAEFTTYSTGLYASSSLSLSEMALAIQLSIFHGDYLEQGSSAVCAIGLGIGCGFLLWLRGFTGPGPYTFGVVFGIILIIIALTIGCLFPYPYYNLGLIFFLPFICQTAITILVTIFVFPETLAHQFCDRLISTLTPLSTIISAQHRMLRADPSNAEEWKAFSSMKSTLTASNTALSLLAASQTNLSREIAYTKANAKDLSQILRTMRVLVSKTTGFIFFHSIVDSHLHRSEYSDKPHDFLQDDLVVHIASSRPHSITSDSPPPSRPSSIRNEQISRQRSSLDLAHLAPPPVPLASAHPSPLATESFPDYHRTLSEPAQSMLDQNHRHHYTPSSNLHQTMNRDGEEEDSHPAKKSRSIFKGGHFHSSVNSLLHDVLHPHREVRPIGLIESERYMDLERFLGNRQDQAHITEIVQLLNEASEDLLEELGRAIQHLISTIHTLKSRRSTFSFGFDPVEHASLVRESAEVVLKVEQAIAEYRNSKRLRVIKPFAALFDPATPPSQLLSAPSHRGLFWCFTYQHSLLSFSDSLLILLRETTLIEKKRKSARWWIPQWTKIRKWSGNRVDDTFHDENPNSVPGLNPGMFSAARDPDVLAPETLLQFIGVKIHEYTRWTRRGDLLFGVKSAILLPLVALPAFFSSSCYFFYTERGIWIVIMAALSSNQYIGDSIYQFFARMSGTFVGAVLGLLLWTLGAGVGSGNPYGIAAVAAASFPLLMFHRIHYTPPISAILTAVTAALIIGYSWQDTHNPSLSSVGYGFATAWRRFVCVAAGVSAAFIFSYIPPSVTQKETVRLTYANVISSMGGTVCQILSFANLRTNEPSSSPQLLLQNIAALRNKVTRMSSVRLFIGYEFSLRGSWPSQQYDSLQAIQIEILDLLGQFLGIVATLEKRWVVALLHRSQFSNPRFLGELLSSFQLISTSLKGRTPLPFIFNPLLERFLKPATVVGPGHPYGFDVSIAADEIQGIPLHVDLATIESIEYMKFSCGISIAYAIVNRIDRLMVISKTLLGETYIVHGLEKSQYRVPEHLAQRWHDDEETPETSRNASTTEL